MTTYMLAGLFAAMFASAVFADTRKDIDIIVTHGGNAHGAVLLYSGGDILVYSGGKLLCNAC
jgi:hypothetical protein